MPSQTLIYDQETLKKYNWDLYLSLKKQFGEDYDLMHEENDMSIRLKDVETWFTKLRYKIGNKFMRINHDIMEIEIKLEKWDPVNKKWILDRIIPGQSYTENYIEFWYMPMYMRDANMQDLDGNEEAFKADISDTGEEGWLNVFGDTTTTATGTVDTKVGIQIGTGSTPFNLNDFKLEAQVTSSWVYDTMLSVALNNLNGQSLEITFSRLIRNKTGGSVNIDELGVMGGLEYRASGLESEFLFERTVLGSSFVIDDLETSRVTYTLRVTASA